VKRADSLLKNVIKGLGIEDGVVLAEIKRDWHILFHEPLSFHMTPVQLSRNELLLNVDSPVWLQELKFYKQDIINKLSPHGVKDVRFRLGSVRSTIKTGARNKSSKSRIFSEEERSYIEKTVSRLNDGDLKTAVRAAMGKAVSAGKTKIHPA
jgi:hypothetical protein